MKRLLGIAFIAALLSTGVASSVEAQGKSELTVALSSFSTEVLDPVIGGHIVKYYLSLMFDYLVGVTPMDSSRKTEGSRRNGSRRRTIGGVRSCCARG